MKIYIVKSSCDDQDFNEKAFVNKEDARKFAKELDIKHENRPEFITDDLIKEYYSLCNSTPDWGEGPKFVEDPKEYAEWNRRCFEKDIEYIISELDKKGYNITKQMLE